MPYDFYSVVAYRFYLDSVYEQIGSIEKGATRPPKYVTHTPIVFDVWLEWYNNLPYPDQSPDKQEMKAMGQRNIPDEFTDEFDGLEEFYQHYMNLTREV